MGAQRTLGRLSAATLYAGSIMCAAFAQPPSPKQVLLVYQGQGIAPANVEFEQSLVQNLRAAAGSNLDFYREQLDWPRFPENKQHKIAELRSQYAERKIDVVIISGNTPSEILPGVPVVQI